MGIILTCYIFNWVFKSNSYSFQSGAENGDLFAYNLKPLNMVTLEVNVINENSIGKKL